MTFLALRRITDAVRHRARSCVLAFALVAAALFCSAPSARATLNNGEPAIDILGQYNSATMADNPADYVKNCVNDGASPFGFDGRGTVNPGAVIDSTNHRLFVSDSNNHRVLVFTLTSGNLISSKTPANVLGQPDFVSCGANTTQSGMYHPSGLDFDATNNRLFVADQDNNRVLVFNTSSITNGMNASYELGQPSGGTAFTTANAATTQSGMSGPFDVRYDNANTRVFVADYYNNRVMVFNVATGSIANGENASYELGQPSGGTAFTTSAAATTQSGLHLPDALAYDSANTRLFVADNLNERVLVFNVATGTIANGENASYELGQPSGGTAFTTNATALTQSGMYGPSGLAYDSANTRLFEGDYQNNRVMVFNVATGTIANGENASYVLGQADFVSSPPDTAQWGLYSTANLAYDSTNKQLYVWDQGNNRVMIFNVAATPPTPSSPTQSGDDACAIASGKLYCWGYNYESEDGTGDTINYWVPVQIGAATNWTAISQGDPDFDAAACGIAGGALYCWGYNQYGELGLGNTTAYTTPQQVGSDTTWTAISVSGRDACGIDNGKLYCWGLNTNGELGLGNTTQFTTPQQVGALTTWTVISQGGTDTCGIAGGKLYCWGLNSNGEDGLNNTTQQTTPQQVGALTTWTVISQGNYDACGIAGGKLYCWGNNGSGELGLGNSTQFTTPQQVGALTTWTAVTIHYDNNSDDPSACGVAGGKLYCWGVNSQGQLGLGNTTTFNTPQQVGALTTWTAVSYAIDNTCAIAGSQLYCWGWNNDGQAGQNNLTQYSSPQAVAVGSIGNGENASDLLGEYASGSSAATVEWAKNGANNGPNELGFNEPGDVAIDTVHHYLYAADPKNNRVLVYALNTDNSLGTSSGGHTASYVLGQPNFYTNTAATTQSEMSLPLGLAVDTANQRLFVTDYNNCRVLVYSTSSLSNGMNASYELGEASGGGAFTTACGGASQSGLGKPAGLAYDSANTRLFVSDNTDNRVMVFNVATGTIANGENANTTSGLLGQTLFSGVTLHHTSTGMDAPVGLAYDAANTRLFVADQGNNRVTVYKVPTNFTNGVAASFELGQPSGVNQFTTYAAATTQSGMNLPDLISYDPNTDRLFVADNINARVTVYNVAPSVIKNGANAVFELGQASGATAFTTNTAGLSQSAMTLDSANNSISCAHYEPATTLLYVCDTANNRVMIFDGTTLPPADYYLP